MTRLHTQAQLAEAIRAHAPVNPQEAEDQAVMLRLLETWDDLLDRSNPVAHFTGSAWIVNRSRTKTLLVHHDLYRSWAWTGGHADGEADLLSVAMREAMEETGVTSVVPLGEGIATLDILPVWSHVKRGRFVASHLHLNAAYLLEADEDEPLVIREGENSGVMWVPLGEVERFSTEPDMYPVYEKLTRRVTGQQAKGHLIGHTRDF